MKGNQSFCLFIFHHSAISFSYISFSYYIWSWVNVFPDPFFLIQLFLFPTFHLHIIYEVESMFWFIHILLFSYFFFVPFICIFYVKLNILFSLSQSLFLLLSGKSIIAFCFEIFFIWNHRWSWFFILGRFLFILIVN